MNIGDKVSYINFLGETEHGIIKAYSIDPDYVFVVYHCDKCWKNYTQYTAQRTRILDLEEGWR